MSDDSNNRHPFFLQLPEVILHTVLTFVAPPTDRAAVLCHRIALLDSSHHRAVKSRWDILWSTIRDSEYGRVEGSRGARGGDGYASTAAPLRSSKRLRRSPKDQVRDRHTLLLDNTKIGHYALSEMAHSSRTPLSLARLRWIFREYGPLLKVNQVADIGGTFLIECCRARYVEEGTVLRCVKELAERHGALPDVASAVASNSRGKKVNGDHGLTPLCVAAARGMPSVVKYLLKMGASPALRGTGRFRFVSNPKKSLFGTFSPLGFAEAMRKAEVENEIDEDELRSLDQCIKALRKVQK